MVIYDVKSECFTRHLAIPQANEVLSAHSTIATLVSTADGTAVFGVCHYLRYAQLSTARGDPPQKEWRVRIGHAEAQTARFAAETEGTITEVIRSLKVGSLVALDWLQVAVRTTGCERVEHPCQKLEPISRSTEAKLLAAHSEVGPRASNTRDGGLTPTPPRAALSRACRTARPLRRWRFSG